MKEFFIGRKVDLLTDSQETKGISIWHMELEEKEMKHMTARIEDGAAFVYVADGSLVCQVNQYKEELKKGEGIFVNKGNAYRFVEGAGEDAELFVVVLDQKYVEADEAIAQKYVAPVLEMGTLFYMKLEESQECAGLIARLGVAAQDKEEGFELQFRSLALELWRNLYKEVKNYNPAVKKADIREKAKLCQMLEFLHSHYKEKITLGELAESSGISTGEYCRFFKKKMERTPFEYLQAYRIEQSLPEILGKTDTISNIALRHGFTGSSYFTETFKKEMGCAPGDYRKWYKGDMEECPLKDVEEPVKTPVKVKEEEPVSIRQASMPAHLL